MQRVLCRLPDVNLGDHGCMCRFIHFAAQNHPCRDGVHVIEVEVTCASAFTSVIDQCNVPLLPGKLKFFSLFYFLCLLARLWHHLFGLVPRRQRSGQRMGFGFGVSSPRCNCALESVCSFAALNGCEAHAALTVPAVAVEQVPLLPVLPVLRCPFQSRTVASQACFYIAE